MNLSDEQFDRARRLASRLAGIELVDRHRVLLGHRSRRVGINNRAAFDALLSSAETGDTSATRRLLCLVTTKFTGFFRHPHHFQRAAEHVLGVAGQRGHACVWSAAAATGEEPYSLAIAFIEIFGRPDPPVTIVATDLDEEALAAAQRGKFSEASISSVGAERRERFFDKDPLGQSWTISPSVRRLVALRVFNLVCPDDPPLTAVPDVIFCRNVLMYLEAGHRCAVLAKLAALLAPDGLLMLDPAEHLGSAESLYAPVSDGIYSSRREHRRIDNRLARR